MKLERLQRWHWAIVAVIVGVTLAQAQLHWTTTDPLTQGNFIEDPQRFESWLLRETSGRPWLRDIVVHPVRSGSRGAPAARYVVTAQRVYDEGGAVTLVPIAFLAAQPYKYQISLDYLPGQAGAKAAEKLTANPNASILDYLATVRAATGVNYRYAWWEDPWKATAAWTLASLLLIAGLWPTLINLLVYHRLTRPPREAGIDLSKVRAPSPKSTPAPATTDLEELEQEMASRLEGFEPDLHSSDSAPQSTPVRDLCATSVESVAVQANAEAQEYGAKPDDYYPTAKRHSAREEV